MGENTLPSTIQITSLNITVENKFCHYMYAWNAPPSVPNFGVTTYITNTCNNGQCSSPVLSCTAGNPNQCKGTAPNQYIEIPPGGRFMIAAASEQAFHTTNPTETCWNLQAGDPNAKVILTVVSTIGGVSKTSNIQVDIKNMVVTQSNPY
jgi:hypothetical protein